MQTVKRDSFTRRTIREIYDDHVLGGIHERKVIVHAIQQRLGSATVSYIYKIIKEEYGQ